MQIRSPGPPDRSRPGPGAVRYAVPTAVLLSKIGLAAVLALLALLALVGRHRLELVVALAATVAVTAVAVRSHLLEVDAGAEIFLFSRHDLGVDPEDAVPELESIRSAERPMR